MAERKFPGKRSGNKKDRVELTAYRFRGYPSDEIQEVLMRNINGCRGFWNILVSDEEEHYRITGKRLHNTPADYKSATGYEWLSELDSLALANVQLDYEKALDAFFSGEAGHPRRKKKGRCRASYTTSLSNMKKKNLFLEGCMLKLPKVKEKIKLNVHRPVREGGLLKSSRTPHGVLAAAWSSALRSSTDHACVFAPLRSALMWSTGPPAPPEATSQMGD